MAERPKSARRVLEAPSPDNLWVYASSVVLMLIDTREPSLPPSQPMPRRTWRPSGLRPLLLVAVGVLLLLVSAAFSPVPAYVLILAACIFIGRGLGELVRNPSGLRYFRQ